MPADPTAPGLVQDIDRFLTALQWTVSREAEHALVGSRTVGGHTMRWGFHFEDRQSLLLKPPSPALFATTVVDAARQYQLFDLILTEDVLRARHWRDYLEPELYRRFSSSSNWKFGTARNLFDRFASQIATALQPHIAERLSIHFIQKPVRPSFQNHPDAVTWVLQAVASNKGSRLILVKGDAGAGKTVFTLMLANDLIRLFVSDPSSHPAPFLLWFEAERPANLDDLMTLALRDLGLAGSVTTEAVRFLLKKGRLLFILDGFDEASRLLAAEAGKNVVFLSEDINLSTQGRLLLTSRPSFIEQEALFTDLKEGCGESLPEEKELAPYTDEQMHDWVIQNPPKEMASKPPESHWHRVIGALRDNPDLHEVCRTPVFLRMLSEVLAAKRSVASRYDLVQHFCEILWERERGKRRFALTDEQYSRAYEAIAIIATTQERVDPKEIKELLDLYLAEYVPELYIAAGEDAPALIADLAIGPLTYKAGLFTFIHQVFEAYFFSRLLARSLARGFKVNELWNRHIDDAVRSFLADSVVELLATDRKDEILKTLGAASSGLVAWNVVSALEIDPAHLPADFFERKQLSGVTFSRVDLRDKSFDATLLLDVIFDRCDLRGTTFRGADIRKLLLVECGTGAIFDPEPRIAEDAQVTITRRQDSTPELYIGAEIAPMLKELSGKEQLSFTVPRNVAQEALRAIFYSLYKSDGRRLDYPERAKVKNRLNALLRRHRLEAELASRQLRILIRLFDQLYERGLIEQNPKRPRTFVPSQRGQNLFAEMVRRDRVQGVDPTIDSMLAECQAACEGAGG